MWTYNRELGRRKMVGVLGLEPRSLAALDFESSVFTNFTILPKCPEGSIASHSSFWQLLLVLFHKL